MSSVMDEQSMKAIKGTTPGGVLKDVRTMKKAAGKGPAVVTVPPEQKRPIPGDQLITPEERQRLELRLHRLLVWVGIMTPFEFDLEGRKVPLHEIVWDLLGKDCLTEEEKEYVRKLIRKLSAHERADEEILHNSQLTRAEAKAIFREAAGLLRAIMSLKSLVGEKEYCNVRSTASRRRVEDARYWLNFLKQIT
ncbi:MAG: hypothetical protein A4E28_03251 [Methanocella sp. PtaU1.Bin125]|nr:MAG: hypothetical protein A4E28_03251 [Methanocella sp. PtaU1.Bin125]